MNLHRLLRTLAAAGLVWIAAFAQGKPAPFESGRAPAPAPAPAQTPTPARPRAEVTPVVETTPVRSGSVVKLSLRVSLPKDIHVQSNKPRDPLLIPTVLTIQAPAGIAVESIEYPKATDLAQPGRKDPLAVYGSQFEIGIKASVPASQPAGDLTLPAVLRYQACNDTVCFPPARAATEWVLKVTKE
jgi:DsbC/DsbD-like thiol-disulfide interchange protein